MESIEKLRKALKDCTSVSGVEPNQFDTYWITAAACDKYIDEIECEIAERYMLLPVDAEGVSIRVGRAVTDDGACLDTIEHYGRLKLHVVKPRTIEDVLDDFLHDAADRCECANGWLDECKAKYADELRGMGVGE